jgi:inorganic pyrophosphatase
LNINIASNGFSFILTKNEGDNDPLDAVELSAQPIPIGTVKTVKILGTYGMIDDGAM